MVRIKTAVPARTAGSRFTPTRTAFLALCAGFMTTAVSADTLAQPRDNALERAAADYIRYREDVVSLEETSFSNAQVTREAHRRLASHDSKELSAGWVAYAALVAAQVPEFAQALEKEVKSRKRFNGLRGKDAFLSRLGANPSYPRELKGADQAIDAILSMTVRDGARITALGETFKEQAYAMQKTKWGKKRIGSGSTRLTDAASFDKSRPAPAAPDFKMSESGGVAAPVLASAPDHWAADWGRSADPTASTEPNADVIIDRVLNLASRYSIGKLNAKTVEVYARNDKSERCLSMAKLTLDQCIAATRSPYEEAFCLGEHALIDTATCTGWVAGAGAS